MKFVTLIHCLNCISLSQEIVEVSLKPLAQAGFNSSLGLDCKKSMKNISHSSSKYSLKKRNNISSCIISAFHFIYMVSRTVWKLVEAQLRSCLPNSGINHHCTQHSERNHESQLKTVGEKKKVFCRCPRQHYKVRKSVFAKREPYVTTSRLSRSSAIS